MDIKTNLEKEVAHMVENARIGKGLTQLELAALCGSGQPAIANIENAKRLPTLRTLQKIAEGLGLILIPPKFKKINKNT